ncbi:MAG: 5-methyltetrahydrofolate-homocysteine methyltransferase [Candidatus Falkowbacteria bacterium GW2011_GWC2_38_22]|uniref:5-methyltetrahydrofolate-homocysteine methyltransferase n=1 Tax=Candidatus Falkowbacteria bacterium GW2011_GWE1_38_31 TaxID=1618638 RepID=A0A0G0JTI2_9BACT|nr:MAG: 5-methyltetrahydrofolate-homocysteine methyltransferase [Candidatus Falkowbacteria bacterium GW2011_GWF2_38_1205]KKQ61132.1 MAG: 5-methyltetrahydrofolate-homocysteine methyltransferase [Candidatus Falkowbacteria bacterium GW2011_GWC2_38_22]KKQ63200.1 MAG: 5-methyltetrahydrofolate-homocysteine methyltransferase [Candidatus Falkowbacteria bacterium GW2011_GWF1_38_22]KKQ65395.1 MAG: 5-methyltetrahydrofolate-homocysteine methyltransferase [Candidatus Falkowbacteria bacterium GW2011_GWE2_38_2
MYKKYKRSIYEIAKELRKNMTLAEKTLWQYLRNNALDIKFRRQEPFYFGEYRYVADFYCPAKKMIIEIDGDVHDDREVKEYDEFREEIFNSQGYKIIRFSNEQVLSSMDGVLESILKALK